MEESSEGSAHTLSRRGGRCFLRRRCRLRSLEAVLCSVALLNLQVQGSPRGERSDVNFFYRLVSVPAPFVSGTRQDNGEVNYGVLSEIFIFQSWL